jgi:hypothetical protein
MSRTMRARLDRLTRAAADELWIVDTSAGGDGLAHGPDDLVLTRAELDRLPHNPARVVIAFTDEGERRPSTRDTRHSQQGATRGP